MKRLILVLAFLLIAGTMTAPITAQYGNAHQLITPQNVAQIRELYSLGHGRIHNLAWSSNGKMLAVASSVGVWLYDIQDANAEPYHLGDYEAGTTSVVFSPDGHWLAWGEENTVRVLDLTTQSVFTTLEGHASVSSLAFSPDGTRLASGDDNGWVHVWEVMTGELLAEHQDHAWTVSSVCFSPDGQLVASIGLDGSTAGGEVPVWDLRTDTQSALLVPFTDFYDENGETRGGAQAALFSEDGKTILMAGGKYGYWVQVWDIETRSRLNAPIIQNDRMTSVSFSSDAHFIAASGEDNTIRVWDTRTGDQKLTIPQNEMVEGMAFSPDGQQLAAVIEDGMIRLWSMETGSEVVISRNWIRVASVAFDPNGRMLACVMSDGTLEILDTTTNLVADEIAASEVSILSAAFSPDERLLAFGGKDGTLWLWDIAAHAITPIPGKHFSSVTNVVFSPDSKVLISSSDDSIQVWDVGTRTKTTLFNVVEDTLSKVAFSPDGRLVVMVNVRGSALLYDAATGSELSQISGIRGIDSIEFSPPGQTSAFQVQGYPGWLWNIADGSKIMLLATQKAALTPNWQLLAIEKDEVATSEAANVVIEFWNVASGQYVAELNNLSSEMIQIAFSPAGTWFVSVSLDGILRLWGVE